MRTPGRCTNFETCWLANGRRDIRVMVGDPFVCPACGEPLQAPSIESISASGIAGAVAVSLALIAAAGGAGFGTVRLAQTASLTGVAVLTGDGGAHFHKAPATIAASQPVKTDVAQLRALAAAPALKTAAPGSPASVAAAAQAPVAASPSAQPVAAAVAEADIQPLGATAIRAAAPVPAFATLAAIEPVDIAAGPASGMAVAANPMVPPPIEPPHAPGRAAPAGKVIVISAEPHRQLTLPISFGRPKAPEDDAPARSARWHHHAIGWSHRTGFEPPPVWSMDDAAAVQQVQQAVPPAEGDGDYDSAALDAASAAPPPVELVPAQQADTAVPGAPPGDGASFDADSAPPQLTRLIVPVLVGPVHLPAFQDAARIDPAVAAQVDRVPDAEVRLAAVPPAPPAKLAVPAYPPQAEAAEQPGRVDVGCVITARGLPSGCQVQRQQGGQSFAQAVLSWLQSGTVRYRPSVAEGHPTAEARQYKVRFEP
jgi:hypothetical protein